MADHMVAGGGGGGAGGRPATPGPTRHQILTHALAGKSVRAIAVALVLHRTTVQEHLNRLIAERVLVKQGGKFAPGPAFSVELAKTRGGGSDRPPPGPATGWGLMTSGLRTFTIRAIPDNHPSAMPGFTGTKLAGRGAPDKKRQDHRFRFTVGGKTHELLMMHAPTTNGWSLQYVRCNPPPRQMDLGTDDKETLWDRFTTEHALSWSRLAGVNLDPAPRRSRPVDLAFPGIMPEGMKWHKPDHDADSTPAPQTWESRKEELSHFIETGAAVQKAQGDALADLESRLAHAADREERIVRASSKILSLLERGQDAQTVILQALAAPILPSSQPTLSPVSPGVEFA